MKLRRVRQDFDHLTSWVLLVVAAGTIVTGLIVHLWDLHGFVWHTWFGYAMTVAVLVHVCLNFRQLTAYAGFRLKQGWRAVTNAPRPPPRKKIAAAPAPRTAGATARAVLLSRRGLAGLALGGAGGYLLGQSLKSTPQLAAGSDLGLVYHRWSSDPGVVDAVGALRNLGRQPPLYKSYGDTVPVALSRPSLSAGLSTEQAILRRHSIRAYAPQSMTEQELSRVLALTGGLMGPWSNPASGSPRDGRRSHPSSGALYPIETYAVVHNVAGVAPGVYHYGVEHHVLHQVRAGDYRQYVVEHGLNQQFLGECAAVIYLTMIFQRMRFKYGERSYRYGLVEAGHLGQNLYLAATSLGLGACAVGAYDDRGINELLMIDGAEEVSVYLLSLGRV